MKSFRIRGLARCASLLLGGVIALSTGAAMAGKAKNQAAFNQGFYIGGLAGRAYSDNIDRRNNGSTRSGYLSGQGFSGTLVGGYDWWLSDVMVGAELEFAAQDVEGSSVVSTGTAKFSIPRTYGLSLRAGMPVSGRVLPYAKIGIVASDARIKPNVGESSVDSTLLGTKFGAGLDVPIGGGWTWKSEIAYTRYLGWSHDYPNASSSSNRHVSFNDINVSSVMTGVSYGFGTGHSVNVGRSTVPDLGGFYVLGTVGRGGTNYDYAYADGISSGKSYPSSSGVEGGVGIGYRTNIGDWFVAPELDISRTDNAYRLRNAAEVTIYRLEKKWEAAAAVRGGYSVTERLAAYGKIGVARGNFRLAAADACSSSCRDSKNLYGLLLGVGVEYNLGGNLSVRAEYDHRIFEDWSTSDGSSVKFSPVSGTTKIGLAYYF